MCGTVGTEGLEPIRACGCDATTQHAGTRVVGCWITTCAAVTWEHQGLQKVPSGLQKVPSGLQQSLHQVLFCAEGSSGTGEAACGKLLAAALSEEPVVPKVLGAHAASVPQVQPGSCLVDAEMRSLGGSLLVSGQPAGV